ncbi:hypothetical protein C7S20_03270 [Christiangramia fulva]|uniref:UspA domain-containing protein n=1 Tax=Christiangramia fulva TaxID=2126553 RepID=A0A2R3Z283_9FLAO|nr:universal stress protein [Christiangramia fulva]AVR44355.1 hypothetical protein C7S20_03270 [Christiangramia fulva]
MNVLLLTDFSKVSENAGKYAVDFLQDLSVNFYLLNIQDFNFKKTNSGKLENQLLHTWEKLQDGIASLEEYSRNENHHFSYVLSSENLITAVRKALDEKKIDLIFIGMASHEVHHHPILGDHAYEVIRKIRCNIMAVPGESKYEKADKLVLPVDYSVLSGKKVHQLLESKKYISATQITLIELDEKHAGNNALAIKEEVASEMKNANVQALQMAESEIFTEGLLSEIQDRFDMIVVLGKNLSVCDRLLHARHGVFATTANSLPILVIHQ